MDDQIKVAAHCKAMQGDAFRKAVRQQEYTLVLRCGEMPPIIIHYLSFLSEAIRGQH